MNGINNPADIGSRAINFEQVRRRDWLTGPACLRRAQSEWPEQLKLASAADEENKPSSVLMTHAEKTESGYSVGTTQ